MGHTFTALAWAAPVNKAYWGRAADINRYRAAGGGTMSAVALGPPERETVRRPLSDASRRPSDTAPVHAPAATARSRTRLIYSRGSVRAL